MNETDCRLLAEQMGKKWHKWNGCPHCGYYCSGNTVFCTPPIPNPTFQTPSEREELLNWAMGREWWERFSKWAWEKWDTREDDEQVRWLFSAPEYRYVQLILDYGKEQLGWKLKGG